MWFNTSPQQRIVSWRDWRNSLENQPAEEIIKTVASTWAQVPTVMHLLSPDQPEEWPRAWRLINDNYYCDLAICLGMFYSLALLENPKFDDIEIKIYKTPNGWINLSSVDQGKYVLNYSHGQVVNSAQVEKDDMELAYVYSKIDLYDKFN